MKDPKQICKERNLYSYQAYKGAEVMAEAIRQDVADILTTPRPQSIYEQLRQYFDL